jgi:hypothetical protein
MDLSRINRADDTTAEQGRGRCEGSALAQSPLRRRAGRDLNRQQ